MDKAKAKKYIDKINQLYKTIEADDEIHSIEQDLLKSYVRSLYEVIIDKTPTPASNGVHEHTLSSKMAEEISRPVVVKEETAAPPAAAVVETAPPPVKEKPKAEAPKKVAPKVPTELEALFEEKGVEDLSDKLSRTPIKDLMGAMSINEKIFAIQELFNNNKDEYSTTLEKLNGFSSFAEAKAFLINGAASSYDWHTPDKLKKAEQFIDKVKRRYQS